MRWTQRLTFQWMLGALFAGGVMAMQATPVSAAEIRATVSFSASDYEAKQSGGMLQVPVIRSNVRTAKASVNYFTTDGSARAGIDYTAKSGTLYWRRGDSSAKTIEIPIRTVAAYSGSRSFTVHLTNAQGAAELGIPSLAKVTIVPDSSVPDVDPQPYINSFSPASGPVGTVVTVIGSGFTGVNAAWVGTSHNAAVSVLSDTSVEVTIPSDASTGAIGIFNNSNVSFSATSFTVTSGPGDPPSYPQPYIANFSPASGGIGTIVTINGSGFTGLNAAWVGAAHNASVAVLSDSQVKVTVPTGATSGAIGIFNPTHVAFTASSFTVTSSPPPPPPPGSGGLSLRTQGNRFIDGNGNYVQLRGVNYSGFEFAAIQGWSGNDPSGGQAGQPGGPNWAALQSWKVNILRIPLNEASWLGGSCVDTSGNVINPDPAGNYRSAVQTQVEQANAAGLYVILDLHWSAPGNACPMLQTQMANADHSLAFWTSVAGQFKNNPSVMFELFNEPFFNFEFSGDAWSYMMKGTQGSFSGFPATSRSGNWTTVKQPWAVASYQAMLDAVRATGATNVVLIGGMMYAQEFSGWLSHRPTDPLNQMAAVWHPYPTYGTTWGSAAYAQPNYAPAVYDQVLSILAAGIPVIATETGDRNTAGTVGAPLVENITRWADLHGIGLLGWGWNVWGSPDHVLIKDVNGTPTDGYGKVFRAWLLAH